MSWTKARSDLALEIQANGPDSPRVPELRQRLRAARAEAWLKARQVPRQLAVASAKVVY